MPNQPLPPSKNALSAGLVAKSVKTSPVSRHARQTVLPWRSWLRLSGLTLLLAGAGTLVGLSLWTSAMVILRPHPPRWLVQYWPGLTYHWGDVPVQTATEIAAELDTQQQYAGEWLDLSQVSNRPELMGLKLLPIFATRSACTHDCETIVELRLYGTQPGQKSAESLQLLHQLPVQGPTESEVMQSLSQGDANQLGSTYELSLTALKPLHEDELPGTWLTLTGRWRPQGSPILYGQVLYVNPQLRSIHSLLNWQSPSGRLPAWHNIDQQGTPELLVNQSYGLEPSFQLYRVANLQAIGTHTRLEEITLTPLPMAARPSAIAYKNALFLAQRGLWSDAQTRLSQVKTKLAADWSVELEQQWQLVALHGRFSAEQAQRDWSQPSQKLLSLLLDGQWQAALTPLKEKKIGFPQAVLPLLKRDFSRVWPRLTATLQVNPNNKEARFWGALLLMAKEDEAAALKWLADDTKSPLREEFKTLAQTVTAPPPSTIVVTTQPASNDNDADVAIASTASPLWDGLLAEATSLENLDPADWQRSANAPTWTLSPGQQWFTIALQAGYTQQQWQPFSLSSKLAEQAPEQLWQTLGLGRSATLQGIDPTTGNTQTLTVMGAQRQGQQLTLLARGVASPHPLIATTPGLWNTLTTASPTGLANLLQSQPALSDRLLPTLQNHLGFEPVSLSTILQQQANAVPPWATARQVNLVGGSVSELIVSLSPELLASQGLAATGQQPTELIVTAEGELLYSSVWSGTASRLVGWVQSSSHQPVLVVRQGDRPQFLFWSPQNRRFQ